MADKQQNPLDFMSQMYDLQQQYLNNLQQAFSPNTAAAEPSLNPFEQWWKQIPSSGQSDFDQFFKQMSELGMGFMANPAQAMQGQPTSMHDLSSWFGSMNKQFSDWMQTGTPSNPVFDSMNEQFRQQMQAPFGQALFPWMQNQFANPITSNPLNSSVLQLLQNLFNADEKQSGEQLLHSLESYQNAMMQFNHLMAQIGIDSMEQLQKKLSGSESLDAQNIFQHWMKISQEVFNQDQLSSQYQELQEKLQAVQQQLQQDYEAYRKSLVENLGLITRDEFDAQQQELDLLKQQLKNLGSRPSSAKKSASTAQDDFTKLKGIGAKFNEKLHEQGIHNLDQLASLSDDMIKNLDGDLNTHGKIFQDQWREQAEQMLNAMTGKKGK